MDIIKIIGSDTKYTFHSHTQFCDGRANMEDFAIAAVSAGFKHYGFSPHSPVPIASPCNMSFESVTEYLQEVERIKLAYGKSVNFYAGMEIDFLGKQWGPSHDYFKSLPLDYRIGSVHFIPDKNGEMIDIDGSAERFKKNMSLHFGNDIRYVVETFYDESCAMLEAGGFDIIGHFDKIAQNASYYQPGIEDEQWYDSLVRQFISLICQRKPIVEINTKSKIAHNRIFPSERYLPELVASGVEIIVNSDAHEPQLIDASRQFALYLLESLKPAGQTSDAKEIRHSA